MWTHLVYNPSKQPVYSVQRSAVCAVAGNNNVFIFVSPGPSPVTRVTRPLISSLSDPEPRLGLGIVKNLQLVFTGNNIQFKK